MARSFVKGGTSATGIATGVPYIRRIVRKGSSASTYTRHDKLSHFISGHPQRTDVNGVVNPAYLDGKILAFNNWFKTDDGHIDAHVGAGGVNSWIINSANKSRGWRYDLSSTSSTNYMQGYPWLGEAMHIEFPATTRTFSVQFEAANYALTDSGGNPVPAGPANREHRLRIMLTCPGQRVVELDEYGNPRLDDSGNKVSKIMDPVANGNYIEISEGETATFDVRTSHFFVFLATFDTDNLFNDDGSGELEGPDSQSLGQDAVSFLVTAILEHDGSNSRYGTATKVIGADGQESKPIKKVYPQSTNINQDYVDDNGDYIGNTSGVG